MEKILHSLTEPGPLNSPDLAGLDPARKRRQINMVLLPLDSGGTYRIYCRVMNTPRGKGDIGDPALPGDISEFQRDHVFDHAVRQPTHWV